MSLASSVVAVLLLNVVVLPKFLNCFQMIPVSHQHHQLLRFSWAPQHYQKIKPKDPYTIHPTFISTQPSGVSCTKLLGGGDEMAEFTGMSYALKTVRIGQWNLVLVTYSVLKGTCVWTWFNLLCIHSTHNLLIKGTQVHSGQFACSLYGEKRGRYEIYEILASIIGRLQIQFWTWPILTTSPRAMPEWLEGLQSLLSPK